MPLVATEMLWDRDIQTLGAAAAWEIPAGSVDAHGRGRRASTDRSARATARASPPGRSSGGSATRRRSPSRPRPPTGTSTRADLKRALHPPELLRARGPDGTRAVRLPVPDRRRPSSASAFRSGRFPSRSRSTALTNFGVARGGEADERIRVRRRASPPAGSARPATCAAFYTYQYVERDAVLGAYNTDDWWFHTWYRGPPLRRSPSRSAAASSSRRPACSSSGSTGRITLNRVTVDLVKMF